MKATEDDRINVYSSRDDGLTWSVSMTLVPYDYVLGIWDDGRIVLGNFYDKTARLVPGDDPIPYPSDTTPSLVTGRRVTRFADGSVVHRGHEYPADQYLVRESPDGGILERFKIPQRNASLVQFGPRLSDSEQFFRHQWETYVIDWDSYELHAFDTGLTDDTRPRIVGIRQD